MHWPSTPGDTALISCAPVPAAGSGPGHPTPRTEENSCLIQNNLAVVYPQQHLQRHKMDLSMESQPGCRRGFSAPHPQTWGRGKDPVVAPRMLQQLQLSEMSLQPCFLLHLVEGELLHSLDPTEHQLISYQGQGPVLSSDGVRDREGSWGPPRATLGDSGGAKGFPPGIKGKATANLSFFLHGSSLHPIWVSL